MVIFHTDLDNTLIYSYKHNIGENKTCVEVYQERDISFMTNVSLDLLRKVQDKVLIVPTTTRTIEQYQRINLGIGVPEYSLVCNGGVLLINGNEDKDWYEESLKLVENSTPELSKGELILENDKNVNFEIRNIKGLFVFTKSLKPEETVSLLKESINLSLVDVFSNGVKVYIVPKGLSKGNAIKRFRCRLEPTCVIAAGDSEFDISMLSNADVAIAPKDLQCVDLDNKNTIYIDSEKMFSEELLKYIMQEQYIRN